MNIIGKILKFIVESLNWGMPTKLRTTTFSIAICYHFDVANCKWWVYVRVTCNQPQSVNSRKKWCGKCCDPIIAWVC